MTDSNFSLLTEHIRLSYGPAVIISDLSCQITGSEFIGLIGPNGAGKTTFLKALAGQFRPDSGMIAFNNHNIYHHNLEYKQQIAYVHENPFLYPWLTVEEFMRFVAGVRRIPEPEAGWQIERLLDLHRITAEKNKPTAELSMGNRKKTAIAAARLGDPRILFLDEALNGVDFESSFHIKKSLQEFVNDGGTVILSTHIVEVLQKICNRYLILKNGEVVADLRQQDLEHRSEADLESYFIGLLNLV